MKKLNLAFKILLHITFVVFVLLYAAGPILLGNASVINSFLGIETQIGTGAVDGNKYFNTKFKNMEEVKSASFDIVEETMEEGAVLLKNDNDTLPLSKGDSVTLYGLASHYSAFCGQGSGGLEGDRALNDRVSLFNGLKNAGLEVNAELNEYYSSQSAETYLGGNNFMGGSSQESQYVVTDIPWANLPAAKENKAKAAVVVIARNSGEAEDLYMDVTMDDGSTRVIISKGSGSNNKHNDPQGSVGDALSLTENERGILKALKGLKQDEKIDDIVVIMNTAYPMQCAFLDDEAYGVDACLWVGTLGSTGATAIGKLLTGEYNPSGRASDTFWADNSYNPVYYNFGSRKYGNASALSSSYFATMGYQNHQYYVAYQEGIYMGYRYAETRYEDVLTERPNAGTFDYGKAISYPFGYGLSYSQFTYSGMTVTENKNTDTYTVKVNVTNTSDRDGKEAVQIYLQKPYTQKDIANGVEKSSVELVGFTKVSVPAGKTVEASVEVKGKHFAAYDANVEKTYVIGSDDRADKYLLTAAKDSHDAVNNILRYKNVDEQKLFANDGRDKGDASLVWEKYFAYDKTTYSTNEFIKSENENFTPAYEGQKANYGVDKITNQFEDTDFKKAGIFSDAEEDQTYMSRNNWIGTYGKRITLTANAALREAQKNPAVEKDNIPYPVYDEVGFYESLDDFDVIKLIYLRGKDYNDPLWDTLLNRMSWEETCALLQTGFRVTNGVESIAAPSSSQQNGGLAPNHSRDYGQLSVQSGFKGFVDELDPEHRSQLPAIFLCNGTVAATFNVELIQRLGEQTGEEAAWAGYNGIYGLGVNIHRGAYCGRQFEYYSEDGFLTGVAAGYEAVGLHKLGVFVLAKHAVLNDQETHRAGLNVWADEQTIREIYSRALEIAIEIDREYTPNTVLGMMTGMNRMGAKWTGGQGFCNTVLRAEYGMRGFVVSDYNSSRPYMSPIQGVLYGNDLPDGNPAGNKGGYDYDGNDIRFTAYKEGYGELAWCMRAAAKNVLYTVVNSNTMNGITGDSSFRIITPVWELAIPVATRTMLVIMIWAAVCYFATWAFDTTKSVFNGIRGKK